MTHSNVTLFSSLVKWPRTQLEKADPGIAASSQKLGVEMDQMKISFHLLGFPPVSALAFLRMTKTVQIFTRNKIWLLQKPGTYSLDSKRSRVWWCVSTHTAGSYENNVSFHSQSGLHILLLVAIYQEGKALARPLNLSKPQINWSVKWEFS